MSGTAEPGRVTEPGQVAEPDRVAEPGPAAEALTFTGRYARRRRAGGRPRRMAPTLAVGLALAGGLLLVAVAQGLLVPHDPAATELADRLHPPDGVHLLGTDQLGRDVLSRVLTGLRWSLGVGLVATTLGATIGTTIGIVAGWSTGWPRALLTRVVDLAISFPYLVIAIVVVALVGRGFWPLALTLGVVTWPTYARVVYAETLSLRTREYVLAARLIGASPARNLLTHVLPGLRPTLLVLCAFQFADILVAESGLSFLGLGAPLGSPTWGNMLAESRAYLVDAPWLLVAPAGAIVVAVVTANLLGDGLAARSAARRSR